MNSAGVLEQKKSEKRFFSCEKKTFRTPKFKNDCSTWRIVVITISNHDRARKMRCNADRDRTHSGERNDGGMPRTSGGVRDTRISTARVPSGLSRPTLAERQLLRAADGGGGAAPHKDAVLSARNAAACARRRAWRRRRFVC